MSAQSISVIIPAYNAEKTIAEAIESVLSQTFKGFELILVNDGSNDSTLNIINNYKEKDPRIRVLTHDNIGLGLTRNKGISESKNELIAFLDADDVWLPRKLESQLKVFSDYSDASIVVTDAIKYEDINITLNQQCDFEFSIIKHDNFFKKMLKDNFFFNPVTSIIRKKLFIEIANFTDDYSGQDYYPFLMFALHNASIYRVCMPLYGERALSGSLQRSKKSHFLGGMARVKAIRKILENFDKYNAFLNEENISLLKNANDKYLCWSLFGARKFMCYKECLILVLLKYSYFFNKIIFIQELLKTIFYPIKSIFLKS